VAEPNVGLIALKVNAPAGGNRLLSLDRFTGLGHSIDQRELDAFGVALRPTAATRTGAPG
jgi:hypothetical protein